MPADSEMNPVQPEQTPPPHRTPSTRGSNPPRGILKNAKVNQQEGHGLSWDEDNLALNEIQKDSTMIITEPKTPFVRYNADTDEVMDLDKIPGFELGNPAQVDADNYAQALAAIAQKGLPSSSANATTVQRSGSVVSSSGSGGYGSRRGSSSSEKMVKVDVPGGLSSDAEDDDELADEETKAHRRKFAEMRGGHYRNEGEAMKRALASTDDDESSGGERGVPPPLPNGNGI